MLACDRCKLPIEEFPGFSTGDLLLCEGCVREVSRKAGLLACEPLADTDVIPHPQEAIRGR